MRHQSAYNSNYKISDRNGSEIGIYSPELRKMIIGIPRGFDITSDDTMLLFDHQVLSVDIPDYYARLFQLPKESKHIVEKAVNYLVERGYTKNHMGKNLESVVNYSFNRFNQHLSELVKTLFMIKTNEDLISIIATLDKAIKTSNFRFESQLLSGYICAYNLISPTFCKDGKGSIYIFNDKMYELSSYEIEEIGTRYNSLIFNYYENIRKNSFNKGDIKLDIDKIFDIEKILNDDLKLEGMYEKWDIQSMYRYIHFNKNYSEMIQAMLS